MTPIFSMSPRGAQWRINGSGQESEYASSSAGAIPRSCAPAQDPQIISRRAHEAIRNGPRQCVLNLIATFSDPQAARNSFYIGSDRTVTAGRMSQRCAFSFRVVKDHAERISLAGADPAHAMAKRESIGTALPLRGAVPYREEHGVALAERHDLPFGLRARPLFDQ